MYAKFEIFKNRKFNLWLFTYSAFERKILDELNMIISRTFSGNVWTLELMLKYFNNELQAKGNCVPFKSKSMRKMK